VLIPDFRGNLESLGKVVRARPDVLGHNVETVPRLYAKVRPGSSYRRSLEHLRNAKSFGIPVTTKSGLMLGLGESDDEVRAVLRDLRDFDVDIVTIGQYLQPTREHLAVERFYTPEDFNAYRDYAFTLGFRSVASAPLVRSSYRAGQQFGSIS
jgi:lipoic acid synthetase